VSDETQITAERRAQADAFLSRHRPQLQGLIEILAEIGAAGDVEGFSMIASLLQIFLSQTLNDVRVNYIPPGKVS
jgi:hypothetical protein